MIAKEIIVTLYKWLKYVLCKNVIFMVVNKVYQQIGNVFSK